MSDPTSTYAITDKTEKCDTVDLGTVGRLIAMPESGELKAYAVTIDGEHRIVVAGSYREAMQKTVDWWNAPEADDEQPGTLTPDTAPFESISLLSDDPVIL